MARVTVGRIVSRTVDGKGRLVRFHETRFHGMERIVVDPIIEPKAQENGRREVNNFRQIALHYVRTALNQSALAVQISEMPVKGKPRVVTLVEEQVKDRRLLREKQVALVLSAFQVPGNLELPQFDADHVGYQRDIHAGIQQVQLVVAAVDGFSSEGYFEVPFVALEVTARKEAVFLIPQEKANMVAKWILSEKLHIPNDLYPAAQ